MNCHILGGKNTKSLKVRAVISLKEAVIPSGQKYGLVATKDMNGLPQLIKLKPPSPFIRNFDGALNDLFKVKEKNFLAVFLTHSKNQDVMDVFQAQSSTNKFARMVLLDQERLSFVKNNLQDYLIISDQNGPKKCALVNPLVSKTSVRESVFDSFITQHKRVGLDYDMSINRCHSFSPMNLRVFVHGKPTPLKGKILTDQMRVKRSHKDILFTF